MQSRLPCCQMSQFVVYSLKHVYGVLLALAPLLHVSIVTNIVNTDFAVAINSTDLLSL